MGAARISSGVVRFTEIEGIPRAHLEQQRFSGVAGSSNQIVLCGRRCTNLRWDRCKLALFRCFYRDPGRVLLLYDALVNAEDDAVLLCSSFKDGWW